MFFFISIKNLLEDYYTCTIVRRRSEEDDIPTRNKYIFNP